LLEDFLNVRAEVSINPEIGSDIGQKVHLRLRGIVFG
jgi:hypothetical protein